MQEIVTPVWIDARFSEDERGHIRDALSDWNYTLNGYQKFVVVDDHMQPDDLLPVFTIQNQLEGLIIHYTLVGSPEELQVDPDQDGVLAWVPELGASEMYVVEDRIGFRNLHTIVMHELGHVLGSPHIRIAGSLMYPGYPLQRDAIDVATCGMVLEAHKRMYWTNLRGCAAL